MFEKGEFVVYGNSGVCRVDDVTTLDMESASKDRLYYVLVPVNVKGSRIFTPVDGQKMLMRRIMDREEAKALLGEVAAIGLLSWPDDKQREEEYKFSLKSGDCREWIKIIKTVYLRKQARIQDGKKLTSMDEKYLKQAEDYLYSELSIPLGVDKGQMETFIMDQVKMLETA